MFAGLLEFGFCDFDMLWEGLVVYDVVVILGWWLLMLGLVC